MCTLYQSGAGPHGSGILSPLLLLHLFISFYCGNGSKPDIDSSAHCFLFSLRPLCARITLRARYARAAIRSHVIHHIRACKKRCL